MKNKMLSIMAIMVAWALVLSGCNRSKNNQEEEQLIWMPNPASVYCEENWWTLIPQVDEDGGEYALCELADWTVCEEWMFYRRECPSEETIYNMNEEERVNEEVVDGEIDEQLKIRVFYMN